MIFYPNILKFIKITLIWLIFLGFEHSFAAVDPYFRENFTVIMRENKDGLIERFQDWSIYKVKRFDKTICYMLSIPIEKKGDKFRRAESYFLVSDLINDANEIMVSSGFYYKKNSDIEISFGPKKFYLFSHESRGWAYDKNDDIDLIKEMQKNEEFVITSFSDAGKIAIDKYSLIGFRQAYFKLKEICK